MHVHHHSCHVLIMLQDKDGWNLEEVGGDCVEDISHYIILFERWVPGMLLGGALWKWAGTGRSHGL